MAWTVTNEPDKAGTCRAVLASLHDWFGLPEAVDRYVTEASHLPMLAARPAGGTGPASGFLSLAVRTAAAAEIVVMGVRPEAHRQGCGRVLVEAARRHAAGCGVRYLTVKTLADSHPSPEYARTRSFYAAMGFEPIEVLPDLWGPDLPCLLMLMRL